LRTLVLIFLVAALGAIAWLALYAFYSMVGVARDTAGQLIAMAAGIALLVVVGFVCVLVLMFIGAGQTG
jgi:hypothetical protein